MLNYITTLYCKYRYYSTERFLTYKDIHIMSHNTTWNTLTSYSLNINVAAADTDDQFYNRYFTLKLLGNN